MAGDLVVYFSLNGETERIANLIASTYNCDTVRVGAEDAGKSFLLARYLLRGLLRKPLVTIPKVYFADYDKVYIGAPIWQGKLAPPMAYFIEKTSFAGVEAVPFVTHESNEPYKALDQLADLLRSRGGTVHEKHAFRRGLPKDMVLSELEGKDYKPEKTPDADLEKFKAQP